MKIRPIELIAYIVTLGWFLLLGRYLITGDLDKQLFITASGALGTLAGLIGSERLTKKKEEDKDKTDDKKDDKGEKE